MRRMRERAAAGCPGVLPGTTAEAASAVAVDRSGEDGRRDPPVEHISLAFRCPGHHDVSFDVGEGEICAIIGPNGAGKSSLLNVINGVYQPQSGTITFAGE
jgi:ABC-type multidrug transport system fused ATPase/permease subunit